MVCVGVVAWFLLTIGYPCTYIRVVRSDAVADNTGLLELYDSTGGQDGLWRESRDWGILSDHCQWYGVTCNNDGEVEELRLPDNGLEGNLDVQDLWNLDSLKVLDLSKNSLSGGIPAGISSLPSLTVLDLSSNNLTGNLPSEWLSVQDSASRPLIHDEVYVSGTFPALQAFKVARNNISEDVYMAIQMAMGWKELQVIDISENNLAGELFGALELRHCSSGSVGCNDITLTVHSALTVLLISGNNIEGTLDDIGLLPPTLSVLDISANKLWGGISNDFSQLLLLRLSENPNLNATVLPRFTALSTNSTSAVDGVFFCPDITPAASDGHSMYLEIDASYYMEGGNRSHCMCGDGMGINTDSASCIDCPVGTFSESAGECIACPNRSTTVGQGRSSLKSCVCEVDSFREITTGDGECTACPIGSSTEGVMGDTSVAMCTCNPGLYLSMNEGTNGQQPSCEPCPVGTYKGVSGNSALLCFPCPPGSFGNITGATSEEDCILCPLGTYNNASGGASSSLCIPCPKGTYGQNQTGLFSPSLCIPCPAGTWLGSEGATTAASCELCPENTFSVHIGVTSAESCVPCGDSATSTAGSFVCAGGTGNTKEKLLTYLGVGMGTFIAVFFMLVTWKKKLEKGKAVVDQHTYHLEQQRVMPIRMAKEKRIAHKWAFLFNALETLDIVAASEGVLGGAIIVLYLIIVSIGSSLTIYRLYMVWWVYYRLRNIYISETRPLKAFESLDRKCTRQMITSGQSHLVPEIVLMLNKLQVNKFKIQLAVVVDIPLIFLNLWILWSVEIILIQNPAYIISLCVSTFSAGKISTLIEYHMEIRKRMKKLENLLSIELWGNEEGDMVFDLEGAAVSPDNDDSASELGVFNMDLIQASEESAESEEIRRLNAVYPIDGHVEDAKDPTPPPTPYVAPKKTCSGVE